MRKNGRALILLFQPVWASVSACGGFVTSSQCCAAHPKAVSLLPDDIGTYMREFVYA
jgi:hypothetical protein